MKDGIFEMTVHDISGANYHVEASYAPHQVKTIMLQKGSSVSTDALLLAIENGVDILVLDHFGNPQGRVWPTRPSSTLTIWKNQLALSHTPEGLRMAKEWIEAKLRSRLLFFRKLKGYRKGNQAKLQIISEAEVSITEILSKLTRLQVLDFDQAAGSIRGLEGTAGKYYLEALSALLPEEYQFEGRSAHPAADPFNAFLNYGYGTLYSKAERALLAAGLHPYIGFMHADGYQRRNLVFDFIEPFRIWIDKTVFKLFAWKQVSSVHLSSVGEHGLWLTEDGKRLLNAAVSLRFEEKKQELDGMEYSLDGYMNELAKRCAAKVLRSKKVVEKAMVPSGDGLTLSQPNHDFEAAHP